MKTFLPKNVTFLLVVFLASDSILAQCAIVSQPISQLECEGNSVRFKVVATGSGLTYTWQRKRTTDTSFSTIIDDSNTEFSQTDNIRIGNVGSAQYPNGTQFQVIVSNGTCSVTSSVGTLIVNEIINVTGGTNVTQCFGTNYSYSVTTSYPVNVVSYQWRKSVASGVWNIISDGAIYSGTNSPTLNITGGTPAESGEYRVYITFKSSGADCNVTSTSRNRKITFLPKLTIPAATIVQPSCVSILGTIAVTVQSLTDVYSFDNGFSYQSSNIKAGLVAGFYNVIIKNSAGCVSSTMIYEIVPIGQPSIWDGTTWLNGNPEISRSIIFQHDFNSISDIHACSCEIKNNAKVVVNSEHTLTVANALNVTNGSLTFENNASLIQINDLAVNSGNINYKRHTAPVRRYDFTYWSSPVTNQTLYDLSPNTLGDKYYSYDPIANWQIVYNGAANMQVGKGYSIRAPQHFNILDAVIDTNPMFVGVPNNGIVSFPLDANKNYLLGNPYPSAINADAFLIENTTVLSGTIYFWTHNSLPTKTLITDAVYNYTVNDYASYNRTGGIGIAAFTDILGIKKPTGEIAAAQGFFAPTTGLGGSVVFNNSMRLLAGVRMNNSQFFKSAFKEIEKHRIWLNLTNNEGAFKQLLIGYVAGATNDYEGIFDGITFDGNPFIDFYSINQGVNLAIQGRALPFHNQDSVALGYKSTIKGEFQISIDQTDGVLKTQDVFLEDKALELLHDLKKESYSFNTEVGVFNNRFMLRYLDKNALEITTDSEIQENLNTRVVVLVQNEKIKINSPLELLEKVVLYDMKGRKIYQRKNIAEKVFSIDYFVRKHQVLVAKITLVNNKIITSKIVY